MNVKKLNEIFGYGLFGVGAVKILLIMFIILQMFTGGTVDTEYFSIAVGFAEIILAIGSIVMIIVNIKEQPKVIPGYLLGLGAVLIELIVPSILGIFAVFVECGMYMKAGSKVKNGGNIGDKNYKKIKQDMKNTDWFYGDNDK